MNKTTLGGLILAGLGILFLILGNTKFDRREEVIRFGDFRASATVPKTYPAFRYLGVACIGGGLVLLFFFFLQPQKIKQTRRAGFQPSGRLLWSGCMGVA